MSFALTTEQIRNRSKTVTRRTGWDFLKAGDLLQPIVKGQGLKKGERVEKIGGPIRVRTVTREVLRDGVSESDVRREGFPVMSPSHFIEMFCAGHRVRVGETTRPCTPDDIVTRIEFEYVDEAAS